MVQVLQQSNQINLNTSKDFDQANYLQYQKIKSDQMKEQLRDSYQKIQFENCTFSPKVHDFNKFQKQNNIQRTSYESNPQKTPPHSLGVKRTEQLHKLSYYQKKRDKHPIEMDYEKQCDQCTFSPDIYGNQNSTSSFSQYQNLNIGKDIERIQSTRKQQEITQLLSQQGRTYSIEAQLQAEKKSQEIQNTSFNRSINKKPEVYKQTLNKNCNALYRAECFQLIQT